MKDELVKIILSTCEDKLDTDIGFMLTKKEAEIFADVILDSVERHKKIEEHDLIQFLTGWGINDAYRLGRAIIEHFDAKPLKIQSKYEDALENICPIPSMEFIDKAKRKPLKIKEV